MAKVKKRHLQCILVLMLELGNLALLFLLLMPDRRHSRQHAVQLCLQAVHLLSFLQEQRDPVLNTASLRRAGTQHPPGKT